VSKLNKALHDNHKCYKVIWGNGNYLFKVPLCIYLERMRKTWEIYQNSWLLSKDSNWVPFQHETRMKSTTLIQRTHTYLMFQFTNLLQLKYYVHDLVKMKLYIWFATSMTCLLDRYQYSRMIFLRFNHELIKMDLSHFSSVI